MTSTNSNMTPEREEARDHSAPVIGVSGIPVDHVAIDLSIPEQADEVAAEATPSDLPVTVSAPEPPAEKEAPAAEAVPMVEIIGIRFKKSGKTYYFDPCGIKGKKGDYAIVETARGKEYGEIAIENTHIPESEIVPPIRPMLRIATEADRARYLENQQKEKDAFKVCLEKIEAHKLDMKLVEAQYTFDNSKLLFYFTSAGRVDFRDLVKDLASVFRTRIELRQIGIRDEAKLIGGLGSCGRALCCAGFLTDFGQVSIKMAKEQNLSLNSTKISGTCGRLMCCLRYEYETYCEEIRLTPPVDSTVRTPDGMGTVTETSPLAGTVKVRLTSEPDSPPKTYHRDLLTVYPKGKAPVNEIRSTTEKEPEKKEALLAENLSPILGTESIHESASHQRRSPISQGASPRREHGEAPALRKKDDAHPTQKGDIKNEKRHPQRPNRRPQEGAKPTESASARTDDARRTPRPQHPQHKGGAPVRRHGGNKPAHRGGGKQGHSGDRGTGNS